MWGYVLTFLAGIGFVVIVGFVLYMYEAYQWWKES